MSSVGTIRRIDELGRIVIPKEQRNKLKLKQNDTIELIVKDDNIVLRKYSKILDEKDYIKDICMLIKRATNIICEITDKDSIIANSEQEIVTKNIKDDFDIFEERICKQKFDCFVYPIIINSDIFGLLYLYTQKKDLSDTIYKIIIELMNNRIYI